jgi:two-component system alkaline phosphatase synthesis response regulator PhoP
MTRVLVVEDNANLAFAVSTALQSEGFEVTIASTGPEGVARAREAELIILDLMLPGFDGFRVIRTLREDGVRTPILVLTARGEEADKVRGLRLGADDYVTKPFGAMELLARVDALLRRSRMHEAVAAPALDQFGDVEVNRGARTVKRNGEPLALTPKELDLLIALMERAGSVMSRGELLSVVWGYQQDVTTRTVDMHVSELRAKLEPNPAKPAHIITVRKSGYRFER